MLVSATTLSIEPRRNGEIRGAALAMLLCSLLVIVPCLWQPHIIDGDLGSHIYNAWLARGIERGEYPQLYLAPVHTNVLFDRMATWLLGRFPPATAERLAVSLTVLAFFWGTFTAVRVLSGQQAWTATPLILILSHGWALQLGLMNLHLATGIAVFALALLWNLSPIRVLLGCLLLALAATAQPLPPFWVALVIAYKALYARSVELRAWLLPAAIGLAILCAAVLRAGWIPNVSTSTGWAWGQLRHSTGADQALAYGPEYKFVAIPLLLTAGFVVIDRLRGELRFWSNNLIAHLWIVLAVGVFVVPQGIAFKGYVLDYGYVSQRLSMLLAVVGIVGLAVARPRARVVLAFSIIAALFFVLLYRDTRRLNAIQLQFDEIVQRYPQGQRFVTGLTDWHTGDHAPFLNHMLGRACIGRCFDYGSYEVATRQFRIRARGPNPFVQTDFNPNIAEKFRHTNPGMSLYDIEWCRPSSDELCVKEIAF